MKKLFFTIFCVMQIGFILVYPAEALKAAREGLNLWLNVMIPTLLPFLILTGILVQTDQISRLLAPLKKLWKIVLGISPAGAYAVLVGMLCGYPMGAKTTSDLYENGEITKNEAEYLLTFVNQPSPVFVRTYLCQICLNGSVPFCRMLLILLVSEWMTAQFFRFIVFRKKNYFRKETFTKKETPVISSLGAFLDVSIMNGFETITRLGGYILMFSIWSACISRWYIPHSVPGYLLTGILELTTGLYRLQLLVLPDITKGMLAVFLTACGGICITAQTRSLVTKELSVKFYIVAKLLNGVIAVALFLFVTKIV